MFENTIRSWCVISSLTHALLTPRQSCIRSHSLVLLGISNYKYLYTIRCELTDEEALAFELDEPNAIKITPTHFMADCARSRESPFNKTAGTAFADDFLEKLSNHS